MARHHRGLYLLSMALPSSKRSGLSAIYAFNRFVSENMKRARTPGKENQVLKAAEAVLERAYSHEREGFKYVFEPAFEQAISRFEIPRKLFQNFLEGTVLELHFRQPLTEDELLGLSYHSGGVWGVIASYAWGADEKLQIAGCELAKALWICNRLLHLKDDALRIKTYVPLQWLEAAGVTPEEFLKYSMSCSTMRRERAKMGAKNRSGEVRARFMRWGAEQLLSSEKAVLAVTQAPSSRRIARFLLSTGRRMLSVAEHDGPWGVIRRLPVLVRI